jgi:DNA-binding NtrC family response regulator
VSVTRGAEKTSARRILIIDDQPRVLDVLREILAAFRDPHGYEITTAQSVDDALGILQRERVDLILLDMVMPGIGDPTLRRQGLDLLKRIRDLGVNAPVLMMSGDLDRQKEAEAMSAGAVGYLHKPFDLHELERLVAQALESANRG